MALLGLSSCEEKTAAEGQTPAADKAGNKEQASAAAEQAAPADSSAAVAEAREALLKTLIYDLGRCASDIAVHPELNAAVRNMLEALENYYNQNKESLNGTTERVQLALRMADTTRNLTAWNRAIAFYTEAKEAYDALPEGKKNEAENKRLLSSICNGQAFCHMRAGDMQAALSLYNDGLSIDEELYAAVIPSDGPAIPEKGEIPAGVPAAAAAVFSSYRCLGECQMLAEDPEEARVTLKRGIEMAEELRRMTPEMHMQYIRLLVAIGNLESRCGNDREVLKYWNHAAEMCRALYGATTDPALRFRVEQAFNNLVPNVKALAEKLQIGQETTGDSQSEPAPGTELN